MIIIRDKDVSEEQIEEILNGLNLETDSLKVSILKDDIDPLEGRNADSIVFVSNMECGWLGYHKTFFERHKKRVPRWIILLLNTDSVIRNHVEMGFTAEGIRVHLFSIDSEKQNLGSVSEKIHKLIKIKQKKILIYSRRPACGKRTLQNLLKENLPDWTIETAESGSAGETIESSDAAHILILGKTMKDFAFAIPKEVQPVYILTMLDQNVQTWLEPKRFSRMLWEEISPYLNWTEDTVMDFADYYEFSMDYTMDEIESHIKHDLMLVAGGGYNTDHIHNVNFEIRQA